MSKTLLYVLVGALAGSAAFANPVSYSTTGLGPLSFYADTFTLTGQTGTINLGSSTTTAIINEAQFYTGDSGSTNASETLTLTYNLTLDGVTHAVSQTATWNITPTLDTFLTVDASSPVLFDLGADGAYNVTLDAYTLSSTTLGATTSVATAADFTPVPEPASFSVLALLPIAGLMIKRTLFSAC